MAKNKRIQINPQENYDISSIKYRKIIRNSSSFPQRNGRRGSYPVYHINDRERIEGRLPAPSGAARIPAARIPLPNFAAEYSELEQK